MEDASKEFQAFLSPTRNYTERAQQSISKHRVVPVINKFKPSSSSFVINQRKNSVLYKAVSGVSFQETDAYEPLPSTKRQKHTSVRKRTDSLTLGVSSERTPVAHNIKEPSGARRSRSLTNMKGEIYDLEASQTNVKEITHPFTPVILYSQSRGRQSRYARARERRRASSQARPNLENMDNDGGGTPNPEQPVRPRRTRSVSRTRKKGVIQSFSSESNLNDTYLLKKKYLSSYDENHYLITGKNHLNKVDVSCNIYENPKELDLNVNETDWKKYDAIISEKLDNLLLRNKEQNEGEIKNSEEPEGGYFSLEREEAETNDFQGFADALQQDNYNETIYVSQAFKENCCIGKNQDENTQYTNSSIELPEMELADYSTVHEVGFPEDEGLYEEIFFDPKETQQSNPFYQLDVRDNIAYFNPPPPPDTEPPEDTHYVPIIERKENSTVVYIRCNDFQTKEAKKYLGSALCDQSSDERCINVVSTFSIPLECTNPPSKGQNRMPNHSVWCGCCNGGDSKRSHSVNHSSSCIQSKSGVIATKYSSLADLDLSDEERERYRNHPLTPKIVRPERCKSFLPGFSTGITKTTSAVNIRIANTGHKNTESELSDIDLEIFSPKQSRNSRRRKENVFASNSKPNRYLKRKDYASMRHSSNALNARKHEDDIPKTFKGFLQNSLFNPPDAETLVRETESLVIRDEQIIDCISDSSSEDESDDDEYEHLPSSASPWLEAKNDFEFVAFKDDKRDFSNLSKKRKTNKLLSMHKMMYGSHPDSEGSSAPVQNEVQEVKIDHPRAEIAPERPSRRRTRRRSPKWEDAS